MRKVAAILILIGSLLWAPFPVAVFANELDDAVAAHERGDYAIEHRLLKRLAGQGNARAQNMLGMMYSRGQGVRKDYAEAVKWYRKAAEQGLAQAQTNLGLMYHNGLGVSKDYVLAHVWYTLAAARLSASEKEYREVAVRNRDDVATKMTTAQLAEAQRLAREWKPKKER